MCYSVSITHSYTCFKYMGPGLGAGHVRRRRHVPALRSLSSGRGTGEDQDSHSGSMSILVRSGFSEGTKEGWP